MLKDRPVCHLQWAVRALVGYLGVRDVSADSSVLGEHQLSAGLPSCP